MKGGQSRFTFRFTIYTPSYKISKIHNFKLITIFYQGRDASVRKDEFDFRFDNRRSS